MAFHVGMEQTRKPAVMAGLISLFVEVSRFLLRRCREKDEHCDSEGDDCHASRPLAAAIPSALIWLADESQNDEDGKQQPTNTPNPYKKFTDHRLPLLKKERSFSAFADVQQQI